MVAEYCYFASTGDRFILSENLTLTSSDFERTVAVELEPDA